MMSQNQQWQEINVPGLLYLKTDILTQDPITEVKQLSEARLGGVPLQSQLFSTERDSKFKACLGYIMSASLAWEI